MSFFAGLTNDKKEQKCLADTFGALKGKTLVFTHVNGTENDLKIESEANFASAVGAAFAEVAINGGEDVQTYTDVCDYLRKKAEVKPTI